MRTPAAAVTISSLLFASALAAQTAVPCAAPLGTVAPTPTIMPMSAGTILQISWTSVRGAVSYAVARKNPDGTCWNLTPQGTTSTSVQEATPPDGTYQYQVGVKLSTSYAVSQWATYTVAAPVILTPPPITTPTVMNDATPPAYLNVTGTPTTASMTWGAVTGVVNYVVDRYLAGVSGAALTTLTPTTGFTATSLSNTVLPDPTQTYTFRVTAYQKDGHFGQVTSDFKAPPPTNPTGLTGSANNQTVTLAWQPVQYAAGYLVSGPGISGTKRVSGTTYSFSAPAGTNVYKVGSVFDPGALSTSSSLFPSVTVQVYAPVASCSCATTGGFTEPAFKQVSGSGQTGSFSSPLGTFTVTVTGTSIDINDPSGRNVLSQPLPAAWGVSPTGGHFFLAAKPQSIGGPSDIVVYPVKMGPQKWKSVVSTSLAADGLWGFSNDGSMFITRRYVQSRFMAQAYNLLASTPQSAVLDIDDTNAYGAFLQTSPCGDRVWYWRFLSTNGQTGEGHFYRRTAFPAKQEVLSDADGSAQIPTSAIISPAANVFLVQLTYHKARPGSTSTTSSLQCTP